MTASTNAMTHGRLRTTPRFGRLRPTLRRGPTAHQVTHVQELLRLHPRAPAAIPLCPGGVLDHELLRSWHRSAVAWLIYEIESAPYNQ
jgi:hypothetical protein